ncbi:NERD domain-containing protein, partial [Streptomyces capuensis]|uniref:NERD domain-containing protein n=1 Tax=Streptomyces capuensis TaxID=1464056 RepID=UPI0018FE8E85
ATAALLARLPADGWWIRYNRAQPGSSADLDAVLVSPCGTAVVVLDTKGWARNWRTRLVAGRVHCGPEDRHEQVEKVAQYAARVTAALRLPGVAVWPLLVVHGSPVANGYLTVRTEAWRGPTYV